MLSRDHKVRATIQQLVDACLVCLSFWLAHQLRASSVVQEVLDIPEIGPFDAYSWAMLILMPLSPLVLDIQGVYRQPILAGRRHALWPLFKGCFINSILVVLTLFFSRQGQDLARSVAPLFGVISFLLIAAKDELRRQGMLNKVTQATQRRRFLLIGAGVEIDQIRHELDTRRQAGIDVVAEVVLSRAALATLPELLHEHTVNGVIISARHSYFELVEETIRTCELEGVEAWLVADFLKTGLSRRTFDEFYGRPVMVFRTTPDTSWQSVTKNVMDFIVAFTLVFFLSWVFALVALLIKLTAPGPILFRQQRAGLNGRPFTIFKFRTMVIDAEDRQQELATKNEMQGPVFKLGQDPRIIPVGKFLRRFSIDELPQLFNVLRGEMSLVGPRPLPIDEVKRFDDFSHRRRLSVKPGLTCLWQISGRSNITDFRDWVRLDLEYIDNWSLWLDAKILARTLPAVLLGAGAK